MPLLPGARRTSRLLVAGATVTSALAARYAPASAGRGVQQGLVLGALALGMPHGAADTELLRSGAHGDTRRHGELLVAYAGLALVAAAVVRRGGRLVEPAVLLASAAHFAEGELACWAPGGARGPRLVSAVVATIALPVAVARAERRPAEAGVHGALVGTGGAGGLSVLGTQRGRRAALPLTVLAGATTVLQIARGDRAVAGDTALLTALALLAPPSTAFAAYFGGWHALRHTARVADELVRRGELPEPAGLPSAVVELGRRSAWAAVVGLVAGGLLAVREREHAADAALAAVLGLTVPHMLTVALGLPRRG